MKQNTKTLLIAGGFALAAGGLIYVLARQGEPGADLDALLDEVIATRDGPNYEMVMTYGGWTLDRERQFDHQNLGPGSIVWLRLYPTATGREGPHYDFAAQIKKATRVGSFTVYEAMWVNAPGGLDPNDFVRFTSADVASVAKTVSAVS